MSSYSSESDDDLCPALPPHLLKAKPTSEPKVIGPTLPPGITDEDLVELANTAEEESDSDEVIGPMPNRIDPELVKVAIHRRELHSLQKSETGNHSKRDSWMTDLPEEKSKLAIFGLGARTFASKPLADKGDRSVWTDLPEDKERKKLMKADSRKRSRSKSPDEEEEKVTNFIHAHNNSKQRVASLVDMHSRKKKMEEPLVKERKPFSREEDMKVNRFDNAQKASIMKKANQLDGRFSKGNKRYL